MLTTSPRLGIVSGTTKGASRTSPLPHPLFLPTAGHLNLPDVVVLFLASGRLMYLHEQCHLCLPPFERLARTSHSVPHPLNPPTLIPSLRLPRLPLFYQFVLTLVPVLSVWLHPLQLLSINPLPPQLALVPELIPLTKTPPAAHNLLAHALG